MQPISNMKTLVDYQIGSIVSREIIKTDRDGNAVCL